MRQRSALLLLRNQSQTDPNRVLLPSSSRNVQNQSGSTHVEAILSLLLQLISLWRAAYCGGGGALLGYISNCSACRCGAGNENYPCKPAVIHLINRCIWTPSVSEKEEGLERSL